MMEEVFSAKWDAEIDDDGSDSFWLAYTQKIGNGLFVSA
jgi:hypothetical protein